MNYVWPSSAITEKEMLLLYKKRKETKKPINQIIKEAVIIYCTKQEEKCNQTSNR